MPRSGADALPLEVCIGVHAALAPHRCRPHSLSPPLHTQVYLFIGKSLGVGLSQLGALTLCRALVQVGSGACWV